MAKQNRKAEIKREALKDREKIMAEDILSTLKKTSTAGRGAYPSSNLSPTLYIYTWWEKLNQETILSFRAKSPQPPVEEEDEHFDDTVVCLDTCK